MELSTLSAAVVLFSLAMYSLLDGFDLGVGTLLLFTDDRGTRGRMMLAITPTWDGNETWLIMAGVALFGLFPTAYSVLLPALYLPLIVMLLGLGCRGVAFEFAFQPGARRALWEASFGLGSAVAAACQGLIVGTVIEGISISGRSFTGSILDVFRPYPLLMAVTLTSGYAVLGAGWLHLKTEGRTQRFARQSMTVAAVVFALLATLAVSTATAVQPAIAASWRSHGGMYLLLMLAFLGALRRAATSLSDPDERQPLAWGAVSFAIGLLGFACVAWPDVVPFRLSAADAASVDASQRLLLWGVLLVMPLVLGYSAYAYYVFRGKAPAALEE